MKQLDIGNFEPLVLQIWSNGSVRGNIEIYLLILYSFCLITCGWKINEEGATAAIR
jgi:hypothetical protein